jgi:hypothetical protein
MLFDSLALCGTYDKKKNCLFTDFSVCIPHIVHPLPWFDEQLCCLRSNYSCVHVCGWRQRPLHSFLGLSLFTYVGVRTRVCSVLGYRTRAHVLLSCAISVPCALYSLSMRFLRSNFSYMSCYHVCSVFGYSYPCTCPVIMRDSCLLRRLYPCLLYFVFTTCTCYHVSGVFCATMLLCFATMFPHFSYPFWYSLSIPGTPPSSFRFIRSSRTGTLLLYPDVLRFMCYYTSL